MVIDSSALIAILFNEPEARAFSEAIDRSDAALVSAASLLETAIVLETRNREAGERELDLLIMEGEIETTPFSEEQSKIARRAFRKYGKGRHPAGLNFGDCIAYALAKDTDEPLLFKGTDFDKTDIKTVKID